MAQFKIPKAKNKFFIRTARSEAEVKDFFCWLHGWFFCIKHTRLFKSNLLWLDGKTVICTYYTLVIPYLAITGKINEE